MKWEDLLSLARIYVPEVTSTVISDANALIIFNVAAQKFVLLAEALPTYTTFNAVANDGDYSIATNIPTYAKVRKEGLWWYNSTNSKWVELKSRTLAWLSMTFPQWRDAAAGNPEYCSIDGDEITVYPKPDTSYTSGFKLYHFKISQDMAAGYYPFSGSASVHYPFLVNYEEDLIDYYKYRAKEIMGYPVDAQTALNIFLAKAGKAKIELQSRPDVAKDAVAKSKTRNTPRMFR